MTHTKGGEIIAYLRLQDYKTDLDKGFRLIREMQQLQKGINEGRNKIASKIATDAKALAATNAFVKPYQLFLNAIVHEEELIRKLTMNFNEETFTGFAQEEILKSYLETDELLQNLKPSNFKLPDMVSIRSCYEGLQLIQKTKQTALDNFNNTSTFDGRHANTLYDNLLNYFSNDILYFFRMCARKRARMVFHSFNTQWPLSSMNLMHNLNPGWLNILNMPHSP